MTTILPSAAGGMVKSTPDVLDIEPRQISAIPGPGALATSSSYNYWWPYPTWGATSTTAVTMPTPSLSTSVVESDSPLPTSDGTKAPDFFTAGSTVGFSASSTSDVSTWSTPTATLLPTIASSSTLKPLNDQGNSKLIYILVPILGVVGAILGGVIAWMLCGCYIRRRDRRRYDKFSRSRWSDGDSEKGWGIVRERKWTGNFWVCGGSAKMDEVIPGPRYVGVDENKGEEGACDGRRLCDEEIYGGDNGRDGMSCDKHGDDDRDPFLLSRGEALVHTVGKPALKRQQSCASDSSKLSIALLGHYESDADDNDDDLDPSTPEEDVPWEKLRHKSIKLAMLAKVDEEKKWTDSIRSMRAAVLLRMSSMGGRSDSGDDVGDTPEKPSSDCMMDRSSASRSRSMTGTAACGEEPGFRILPESPPSQNDLVSSLLGKGWSLTSFPFFSTENPEDRYTPPPARLTRMRSGMKSPEMSYSPSPSPRRQRGVPLGPAAGWTRRSSTVMTKSDVPQAILQSPRQVTMTPKMESELFFTPLLGGSPVMSGGVALGERARKKEREKGGGKPEKGVSNKLFSPQARARSHLPFLRHVDCDDDGSDLGASSSPSIDVNAYRGRLMKKTPYLVKSPAMLSSGGLLEDEEEGEKEGTVFTKTYRVRTETALKRVGEIVQNGWSERCVQQQV
ncbi:hypothetical protein AMATHDRAFT_50239 [Amanita thiersii Skay4041]|uniref:Uncharacterized protein n=1 Tax=Amanita thiersii Skay4041 TaxID=703135 RepID=A0A2A9N9D1_9AGAR|nr:hypothetical protein AMATHDRAFT_50239 [Amanita thiersii Skay4041]